MGVNKKMPMRKCVGCQEMKIKKDMIRILRNMENEFILDATGKKKRPGSIYLSQQRLS